MAESFVKSIDKYKAITFATVVRDENHPHKPAGYKSPDGLWEHLGYTKTEDLVCNISWKEIGEKQKTNKPLLFWIKYN